MIIFPSRDSHNSQSFLVEIHTHIISLVEILSIIHHLYIITRKLNLVESATSSYHLVEMCAYSHILDTRTRFMYTRCIHFEIHTYIMYKRTYTVTLDIECWDDLKVEKIDWAKAINLFPDEFIHSSVQELKMPRPVDSI